MLTQRETDGVAGIDDKDQAIPHMRDLLAVEVEQFPTAVTPNPASPGTGSSPNAVYDALSADSPYSDPLQIREYYLGVLDTNNDSVASWK